MEKKTFAFLILISAVLLVFTFIFVSLIFKPNISLLDFDTLEEYNQRNMANNVLFDIIIPFGCPFVILLPIIIYFTIKKKSANVEEINK